VRDRCHLDRWCAPTLCWRSITSFCFVAQDRPWLAALAERLTGAWRTRGRAPATGTLEVSGDTVAPIAITDIKTQTSPPLAGLAFGIGYADTNVANNQPMTEIWSTTSSSITHRSPAPTSAEPRLEIANLGWPLARDRATGEHVRMWRVVWIVSVVACGHSQAAQPDASGADIAACEAVVDQVRQACVGTDPSSDRICEYDALRPLCSSGRTAFVTAMFNCLLLDSCQSPGDPSDASTCAQNLIAMSATDADKQAGAFFCGCETTPEEGCASSLPYETLGYYMLLQPADLATATQCLMTSGCTATTCDAGDPLSGLAACH
jgi:hypothetical protein